MDELLALSTLSLSDALNSEQRRLKARQIDEVERKEAEELMEG